MAMVRWTATPSLLDLALLFLRLGTTAFGGPAAHIALMEDEVVRRRRWLSREQFLDYVGATNLRRPAPRGSGYRALAVDYSDRGRFGRNGLDMVQHGPVMGVTFNW